MIEIKQLPNDIGWGDDEDLLGGLEPVDQESSVNIGQLMREVEKEVVVLGSENDQEVVEHDEAVVGKGEVPVQVDEAIGHQVVENDEFIEPESAGWGNDDLDLDEIHDIIVGQPHEEEVK